MNDKIMTKATNILLDRLISAETSDEERQRIRQYFIKSLQLTSYTWLQNATLNEMFPDIFTEALQAVTCEEDVK